jgi:alkaline phosphatase D
MSSAPTNGVAVKNTALKHRLKKRKVATFGEALMIRKALFTAVLLGTSYCSDAAEPLFTAQGSMAGEATATSVFLQTRLTAIQGPELNMNEDVPGTAGLVCFEYSTRSDFSESRRTEWQRASDDHDFIVRVQLLNLQPGMRYYYRPLFGAEAANYKTGSTCQFMTLPGKDSTKQLAFIVGSCMNYNKFLHGKEGKASGPITATAEDKRLGYPAFAAMAQRNPDFFIGTGDIVYYDNVINGPAKSVPELRECWHEQFRFPRLIDFFTNTASYWSKDDHDFRFNDSDNSGNRLPLPQTGIELFREQMPIHAMDDNASPTYRTHRMNKQLQIWLTEGRDHRSPNRLSDGPDKSLWGEVQREWLKRTLKESDADWKILVSPTPMVGPDDASKMDNHSNLGGFRHEANTFFAWLRENQITGFLIFCGDRHWQYHSIHPTGVEEFACGALNDENAREGVAPGSQKGTDPEGLVKQPYTYKEPTGGFLYVRVSPVASGSSQLLIEHCDDTGKVLNAVAKAAGQE